MKLYSLTAEQARVLRDARDAPAPGLYVPITGPVGRVALELQRGGAAECVGVPRSGGTRSATDPRPCRWEDLYLVPTAWGLELLGTAVA